MRLLILFWNISSGILKHTVIILLKDYYLFKYSNVDCCFMQIDASK
jgi:hypothetical protein